MIGEICGKITRISGDYIVVHVNGIGYLVFLAAKIIQDLNIGDEIYLIIETRFKVEKICLFGFINEFQYKCFNYLSNITGVSDKIATNLAGTFAPNDFLSFLKDSKNKVKINGVGAKTWEKIMFALKDNKDFYNDCLKYSSDESEAEKESSSSEYKMIHDGVQALVSMGINKNLAKTLIDKAVHTLGVNNMDVDLQNLIKEGLKSYQLCD